MELPGFDNFKVDSKIYLGRTPERWRRTRKLLEQSGGQSQVKSFGSQIILDQTHQTVHLEFRERTELGWLVAHALNTLLPVVAAARPRQRDIKGGSLSFLNFAKCDMERGQGDMLISREESLKPHPSSATSCVGVN